MAGSGAAGICLFPVPCSHSQEVIAGGGAACTELRVLPAEPGGARGTSGFIGGGSGMRRRLSRWRGLGSFLLLFLPSRGIPAPPAGSGWEVAALMPVPGWCCGGGHQDAGPPLFITSGCWTPPFIPSGCWTPPIHPSVHIPPCSTGSIPLELPTCGFPLSWSSRCH